MLCMVGTGCFAWYVLDVLHGRYWMRCMVGTGCFIGTGCFAIEIPSVTQNCLKIYEWKG